MTRKQYICEFKQKVVQAVETGELRPAQACRDYQLAESVLTRWRHEVRQHGDTALPSHKLQRPTATSSRLPNLSACAASLPSRMRP